MSPKYKNDGLPRCVYWKHGAYWYVRNGKWTRLGKTEQDMYRELAKVSIEAPAKNTLNEVIRRYRTEVLPGKARSTQRSHAHYLDLWSTAIGHFRPDKIRPKHIAQVHDAMRDKPVSANRALEVIRHVFTKSRRWGYVDTNPASGLGRHPEKPRDRDVSIDEYLAVYELASPTYQVAMELARITGMRQGDILAMRWSQVDQDGIYIETSKNNRKLAYRMNLSLKITIDDARTLLWPAIGYYVIPSRKGGRFTSSGFQSGWQRLMRRAVASGVESFTFHDIRAMAAGMKESDKAAAELLGNTLQATVKHYRRKARVVKSNL